MQLFERREDYAFCILLAIVFIIFRHNLGLMPLLADEPIRALVSLEMTLRHNYIFPTLSGEAYMNKPPLFNWIIAAIFNNVETFREWHLRVIPMLFFLFTAIVNYVITRRYVNAQTALFSSIAFLVSGRILFYDSMMGYIDPLFSFCILLNMFCVYLFSKQQRYFLLFACSYLLCLTAFLLKGLPAFVFQAGTLLPVLILRDQWKKLFSLSHVFGISILVIGLGIYYYEYSFYYNVDDLMDTLWEQSAQRTPLSTRLTETFIHLISFPFQFVIDTAPFSFLLFFCLKKDLLQQLRKNEFVFYMSILFVSNIWVYWLSPETRARYLFMFIPLFFTVLFYLYDRYKTTLTEKILWTGSLILCIVTAVLVCIPAFLPRFQFINHLYGWTALCLLVSIGLLLLLFRNKRNPLMAIVAILLILRTFFNSFILPLREKESPESTYKQHGLTIGALTKGEPVYILKYTPLNDDILFYATLVRKQLVLKYRKRPLKNTFYICEGHHLRMYRFKVLYTFQEEYNKQTLYLVQK